MENVLEETLDVKNEERSNFGGFSLNLDSWNSSAGNVVNGTTGLFLPVDAEGGGAPSPYRGDFGDSLFSRGSLSVYDASEPTRFVELTPVKSVASPSNPMTQNLSEGYDMAGLEMDLNDSPWTLTDLDNVESFSQPQISNPIMEPDYLEEKQFQEPACNYSIDSNIHSSPYNNYYSQKQFSSNTFQERKSPYESFEHDIQLKHEPLSTLYMIADNSPFQEPHLSTFQDMESPCYLSNTPPAPYASGYPEQEGFCLDNASLTDLDISKEEFTESETTLMPSPQGCFPVRDAEIQSPHTYGENFWLREIRVGKNNRPRGPRCWEFLLRLLTDPTSNPSLVKWENISIGSFRLVEKEKIAAIWGRRQSKKKAKTIKYESFARILRYHYKDGKGMVLPVSEKHLVYKFSRKVMDTYNAGKIQ